MAKEEDEKELEPPPKDMEEEEEHPLTTQEFTDELNKLTGRARDAGVRTLKVMAAAGATEVLNILDGVLAGLEGETKKSKPKAKKKPSRA